jgi:pyruvate kinase
MSSNHKQTKIVCTIGPASADEEILRQMMKAGMNVARHNFSHGTHEYHANLMNVIRKVSEDEKQPVAIMLDLQGPKIRVGALPEQGIALERGDEVTFTADENDFEKKKFMITYPMLSEDVKQGERILLDDGLLSAEVLHVEGKNVICKMIDGGTLFSKKGVNFPDSELTISALSDKDKEDVAFGVSQSVDWIALSFVRSAKEIFDLRFFIKEEETKQFGKESEHPIKIIAKIEKREAVEHIAEILDAVDGIMVARGDLGIEMPAEEVPLIQKQLIDRCLNASKPVIVATQMLDSMIRNPRPTRAEVSDIANAVIDHTDAIMLSGETANGKYPVESVKTMARVVHQTESSKYDFLPVKQDIAGETTEEAVSEVANILARRIKAKAILVASLTGDAGKIVCRYRTELPIYTASNADRVMRQLNLSWGIIPFVLPSCSTVEELVERSVAELKARHAVKQGEKIIIVAGEPVGHTGGVNLVEIREIQ